MSISLKDVIQKLERGLYVVPEIQRNFVWRSPQILELLESIYRGTPIGAIIIWELTDDFKNDWGELIRPLSEDLKKGNGRYMIIDGQQRLTSLLLVKKGKIRLKGKEKKSNIFFNPKTEEFELGNRMIKNSPEWFHVTEVLNAEDEDELLAEKFKGVISNPKIKRNIRKLKEKFITYQMHFIEASLEYSGDDPLITFEEISRIFVKVNSTGTRIKMPDLALALLTAKTRKEVGTSFRKIFEEILEEIEKMGFSADETILIRLFLAISTGTTKFKEAQKELQKKEGKELERLLSEDLRKAILECVQVLKELGIKKINYLQSKYLLVPISYLLYKEIISKAPKNLSEGIKEEIAKWLVLASLEKRYTGKLESELSEDINSINKNGIAGLFDSLELREVALSSLDGDYEKRHQTLLLLLYKINKAKDWDLRKAPHIPFISDLEEGQFHHIFPKEFLERRGIVDEWDHFGNITFISKEANQSIEFKDPKRYLKKLYNSDPELLEKHFIPIEKSLWDVNKYEEFLRERLELIGKAIEKIGIKVL